MQFRFGQFALDDTARELSRDGRHVHVTPKALELLEYLVKNHPRAVSKSELQEHLWPSTHVTESNLPVLVHEVRDALGDDPHGPHWVRTVARFGYAFCGDVQGDASGDGCPWDCRILWGGRETVLQAGENVLGRTHEATVWIDDASVSRRHAVIRVSDDGARLEDAASRNGTFVRGEKIDGPVTLTDGDEFVLGGVLLIFRAFHRDGLDSGVSRSTAPLEYPPKTPPV